ncbi:MAG: hypothetical protein HGA79_09325 [Anaerolineales bacterium]|jgi:hypothetical protein|nr:hypothetical protein [Anaerolineales bacterium]
MFDNLRDFSDTPPYEEEKDELFPELETTEAPAAAPVRKGKRKSKKFLGMTAQQRFLISVMLMFTVLLLGTLAMFVLGRMSIF